MYMFMYCKDFLLVTPIWASDQAKSVPILWDIHSVLWIAATACTCGRNVCRDCNQMGSDYSIRAHSFHMVVHIIMHPKTAHTHALMLVLMSQSTGVSWGL